MAICICPDDNKYFSKRQYVFVQIGKCISSQEARALQQAGGGNVEREEIMNSNFWLSI